MYRLGCIVCYIDYVYRWETDSCTYLYGIQSKKLECASSWREELCFNLAVCSGPPCVLSRTFSCRFDFVFEMRNAKITFSFLLIFFSNYSVNWAPIFLLLHNMCIGNNRGSAVHGNVKSCCRMWKYKGRLKYVPVKWKRCWCACCPLVWASFALLNAIGHEILFLGRCIIAVYIELCCLCILSPHSDWHKNLKWN